MTRYDPHPQDYDDARTGPQASREAAGRDETASRVSGDGQGLRGALEALARNWEATVGGTGPFSTMPRRITAPPFARELRAVLAAHPAPEPAADPGVDVVEQVEQVAADAWLAAAQKPGFISRIWRNVALALADANLLRDDLWTSRGHYGIAGEGPKSHKDAPQMPDEPLMQVTVRAHNLHDALCKASTLPLNAWIDEEETDDAN